MTSTKSTSSQTTNWELPAQEPSLNPTGGRNAEDIAKWKSLTTRIHAIGQDDNISKSEMARMIGMPVSSFSGWYSGNIGKGRLDTNNDKVERWIASRDEMNKMGATIPESPPFLLTPTARDIINTMLFAQSLPGIVSITAASGMGKSEVCKEFTATRSNVHLITMTPYTSKPFALLKVLSHKLNVVQHDPAKLVDAIGERLEVTGAGTLLIVDEAQNLEMTAIDQLRHFNDIYGCGIALVGNDEVYEKIKRKIDGATSPQLKSRISKCFRRKKPLLNDIRMILDAWHVKDEEAREILTGIGMKPGALRQIDETMKLASMLAASEGKPVDADLINAAFSNRDVEDL